MSEARKFQVAGSLIILGLLVLIYVGSLATGFAHVSKFETLAMPFIGLAGLALIVVGIIIPSKTDDN